MPASLLFGVGTLPLYYVCRALPLQDLEATLDPARFVRLHRSYLVQGSRLLRIEPSSRDARVALLSTGARIPVSESGFARFQEWLGSSPST